MDELVKIPEQYKVKGTAFRNLSKYIEGNLGEASYQRIADKLGIPRSGKTLPGSWESANYFMAIQSQAAKELGMGFRDFCENSTAYTLEVDLNRIYKTFVKIGGPEMTMGKTPLMVKTYNNVFQMEVLKNDSGLFRCKNTFPSAANDWAIGCIQGGIRGILTVCNRSIINFLEVERSQKQEASGDITEVTFDVSYEKKS